MANFSLRALWPVRIGSLVFGVTCFLRPHPAIAQAQPPINDTMPSVIQARNLAMFAGGYAFHHKGEMPPDLRAVIEQMGDHAAGTVSAATVRDALIAPGQSVGDIPADPDAQWLANNSSYSYLGRAGVKIDDVPGWDGLVLVHLKLDRGLATEATPDNPEGLLCSVAFVDGHAELMSRANAGRLIAESEAVWQAAASGGRYPDRVQTVADLALLVRAVRAYSRDHAGDLPPDLGATLPYMPADSKRTDTPAKRAAIYLSPHAKETTHIPDAPTGEWVNAHTSYVYLGAAGVPMAKVEDPQRTILLHARPTDTIAIPKRGGPPVESVPLAAFDGHAENMPRSAAEWWIGESKKVVASARDGTPLPDFQHTMRDLRLISAAIKAYGTAHDDRLPSNLAATFEYLPPEAGSTPAERARVYLSPRAERISQPPEDVRPEWITARASYVYLGADMPRKDLEPATLLVYAPIDEAYTIYAWGSQTRVVPTEYAAGFQSPFPAESLQELIDRAKAVVAKARAGK